MKKIIIMLFMFTSYSMALSINVSYTDRNYYVNSEYNEEYVDLSYEVAPTFIKTRHFYKGRPIFLYDGGFYINKRGNFILIDVDKYNMFIDTGAFVRGKRVYFHQGKYYVKRGGRFVYYPRSMRGLSTVDNPSSYVFIDDYYQKPPIYKYNNTFYYKKNRRFHKYLKPIKHNHYREKYVHKVRDIKQKTYYKNNINHYNYNKSLKNNIERKPLYAPDKYRKYREVK